jgi:hypothetical protein
MYYHTLANQPVLNQFGKKSTPTLGHFSYDAHRVWLWFPMFSFFESRIDGKIPNEFAWPITFNDIYDAGDKIFCVTKCVTKFVIKLGDKFVQLTASENVKDAKECNDYQFSRK